MAVITFYQQPASLYKASPDATYDALDTGSWASTDYSKVDDAHGAHDSDASQIYHDLGPSAGYATRYRYAAYNLSTPQPGVAINKITVRAILTGHSNNATAVDFEAKLFVITAAGATRTLGGANTINGLRASEWVSNQEWREITAVWATNPSTGVAWTVADLTALRVGVRTVALTDPLAASSPLAQITLIEVEVEAVSTAGNVEQVRHVGSHELRLKRRGLRPLTAELPLRYGDKGPGDALWLAHDALPGPDGLGATEQAGSRMGFVILKRTRRAGRRNCRFELLDPRGYACSFWSPFVTDLAIDEQDTGIAILHRGGGWTTTRAATGYAKRPDGLWTDRAANKPRYHKDYGLLVHGGVLSAYTGILYNTFSAYGGGAFTGWTHVAGGGTISQDTGTYLFDLTGLRSSCKFDVPAAATPYLYQTWGPGWNAQRGIVGIKGECHPTSPFYVNITALDAAGLNAQVFDIAAGTWGVGNFQEIPGALGPTGTHFEWWSLPFTCPHANGHIRLHVGPVSGAAASGLHLFAATALNDAAFGQMVPREFDPTTAAGAFGVADDVWLNNDAAFRVWDFRHGEVNLQFTPLWAHTDLADGQAKVVITAGAAAAGPYMQVFYIRDSAIAGRWVFVSPDAAGTYYSAVFNVSSAAGTLPARLTTVNLAAIWTGSDGELGLPTYTRRILVNGVRGTDTRNVAATLPTLVDGETGVWIGRQWGSLPTNAAKLQYADGYFRHLAIRDWCPPEEMCRRFVG
jgi:hypothetical protein